MTSRWSSVGPPLPTLYEIAAFGSPVFESRMKYRDCVRAGRRHRPALHLPLPGVRDAEPDRSRRRVAVRACELRRGDEPCDLRSNGRRRETALLLPALDAEGRAAGGDEVRRRLDVVAVERRVGEPELVRHQDRVGGLVELRPEGVRRDLAVDEAVARHRAVRQLLALEQEERRGPGRREVAGGDEAAPRLVQVARKHLAVGAEVRVRGVSGRDGLTPRGGEAGDDRAGERLVLGRLDHVGAEVVLVLEALLVGALDARQLLRPRRRQQLVVVLPALHIGRARLGEAGRERGLRRAHGLGRRGAEAEREDGLSVHQLHACRLDDVAAECVGGSAREGVVGIELDEPVAGASDEAAGGLGEHPVERGMDRLRVVAIRGIGRGDRIRRDEHRMSGRVVDRRRVGSAVARPAASVAVDRRVEAHVQAVRRVTSG